MRALPAVSFAVLCLLATSIPAMAHHGNASYDSTKTVTVKGTVTEYFWANPHVFVMVDSKDDAGNTLHWSIEAQSPTSQIDSGWTKNTFKTGDDVTIDVMPAKNGQPIGRFRGRIIINGKVFKE